MFYHNVRPIVLGHSVKIMYVSFIKYGAQLAKTKITNSLQTPARLPQTRSHFLVR